MQLVVIIRYKKEKCALSRAIQSIIQDKKHYMRTQLFTRTTVTSCELETSAEAQRFICDNNMRFREQSLLARS